MSVTLKMLFMLYVIGYLVIRAYQEVLRRAYPQYTKDMVPVKFFWFVKYLNPFRYIKYRKKSIQEITSSGTDIVVGSLAVFVIILVLTAGFGSVMHSYMQPETNYIGIGLRTIEKTKQAEYRRLLSDLNTVEIQIYALQEHLSNLSKVLPQDVGCRPVRDISYNFKAPTACDLHNAKISRLFIKMKFLQAVRDHILDKLEKDFLGTIEIPKPSEGK